MRVQVVNLKQVLENIFQIVQVDEASAFGDTLIDLDYVIDGLDILVMEQLVQVGIRVVELSLEVGVRVLQQVVNVDILLVSVVLFADHPTHRLVDEKLLVRLQILQVLW